MRLCPRLHHEGMIAQSKIILHLHQKVMTTIVCRDTKDLQPHPRALPIISIRKIDHVVDLTENPGLQGRGQGLDLQEIGTEFRIQGSPGLDLLGKIETECQNQEGLDLDLPETYQGDQGLQRLDQHFNPPEINQHIPEIRQPLTIEYHLGKVCLVHQL